MLVKKLEQLERFGLYYDKKLFCTFYKTFCAEFAIELEGFL